MAMLAVMPATASAASTVSFYPANGNAADVIGGQSGALENGASFGPGFGGWPNDESFAFTAQPVQSPATTSDVRFPAAIGQLGAGDFAVSFDIRTTATSVQSLLGNRTVCNHGQWWDIRIGSTGRPGIELDDNPNFNGTTYDSSKYLALSASTSVNDGAWHTVRIVRQQNTVSIYVDGSLSGSAVASSPIDVSDANDLVLGNDGCTGRDGSRAFVGRIDNLLISTSAQASSFQLIYPTQRISSYVNAPQPALDGNVQLSNTNPPGPSSYKTGVGAVGIPEPYSAGDHLDFGAVLCSPTASTADLATLGLGVQNGMGDQNDLTSTISVPSTFQFITTNPVTVDVPKGTIFFYIPGKLGQQVLLQSLVLGDPTSVAAYGASQGNLIGTSCSDGVSVSHGVDGQAGWNVSSPVTETVTASDSGGLAPGSPSCTLDANAVTLNPSGDGEWTFSISGDGTHSVVCSASNLFGSQSSATDTVQIDTTPPVVAYSGNAGTYTVADTVNITCSAADPTPGSGLASSTCQNIAGDAYTFSLGSNSYSADATDNAGNVGHGSTSFTVTVDPDSLCTLTQRWGTNPSIASALCAKLGAARASIARGDTTSANGQLDAYRHQLSAQSGKSIPADQAAVLSRLSQAI